MRKVFQTIFMVLFTGFVFAQSPSIDAGLPTVMGPAPTTAALMKFEEVPVSNYSGTPNITIPILSLNTHSKDIKLDISLNYHSSGCGANEVSSDVGLGWSLFAGGTISRTVRGLPDEYSREGFADNGKLGIYRYPNFYYGYASGAPTTPEEISKQNDFLWEGMEKGKYDTFHDLWQYNFMGHSGSFFIKKNSVSGVLEVVNESLASNLKIVNIYDPVSYEPTGFTVYDDKGYRYEFNVVVTSHSSNYNEIIYYPGDEFGSSTQPTMSYISAFELSQVFDANDVLLVKYDFNSSENQMQELKVLKSTSDTYPVSPGVVALDIQRFRSFDGDEMQGQHRKIEPKRIVSSNTLRTDCKKIMRIDVMDVGKVFF